MPAAPLPEHEGGQSAAAQPDIWPGGNRQGVQTRAEIEAEIADHLALSADESSRRGLPPDAAAADALRRFGDVAAVRRKCWWIQQGDQIMFRALAAGVLVTLMIAMLALGVSGWRVQSALADRLDRLTGELASLGAAQQALLDQQATKPSPEIRGRAYLGDPSRPAADVEVQIWIASDMKIFRRVRTDADGHFRSNALPPGDYFVLAPLVGEENAAVKVVEDNRWMERQPYLIQSAPLYAYPGAETAEVLLDLQFRWGQISVERMNGDGKQDQDLPVYFDYWFSAKPRLQRQLPYNPNEVAVEGHGPVLGTSGRNNHSINLSPSRAEPRTFWLGPFPPMAGDYQVRVSVSPRPDREKWPELADTQIGYGPLLSGPFGSDDTDLAITDGKRTHLRVAIPEEMKARLSKLWENRSKDLDELHEAFEPQRAKIEVIADLPLLPEKEQD